MSRHLWPPHHYLSSYFLKCYRYNVFMLTRGQICTVCTRQSSLLLRACGPRQWGVTKMVRKSLWCWTTLESRPVSTQPIFLPRGSVRCGLPSLLVQLTRCTHASKMNDFLSVETIPFSSAMTVIHMMSKERRDEIESIFRYWRIIYGGIILTYGNHSAMYANRNS